MDCGVLEWVPTAIELERVRELRTRRGHVDSIVTTKEQNKNSSSNTNRSTSTSEVNYK